MTSIAAPVSLNTANQSVNSPGNTRMNAINFMMIEKYMFCLMIFLAFYL